MIELIILVMFYIVSGILFMEVLGWATIRQESFILSKDFTFSDKVILILVYPYFVFIWIKGGF